MGNCLVTKLNGTVNNNRLNRMGELVFDVYTTNPDDGWNKFYGLEGTLTFDDTSGIIQSVELENGVVNLGVPVTGIFKIENKYAITRISMNARFNSFNYEQFSYMSNLMAIDFNFFNDEFDLNTFLKYVPQLNRFYAPSIDVLPMDLAKAANLGTVYVQSSYFSWSNKTSNLNNIMYHGVTLATQEDMSRMLHDLAYLDGTIIEIDVYGNLNTEDPDVTASINILKNKFSGGFAINGIDMRA